MDVLTFLKRVRAEREDAEPIQMRIEELRATLLPAGIRYDRDKVQFSPADRMPEVMGEIDELIRENQRQLERLAEDIATAHRLVSQMPTPEYQRLITLRYLTGRRTSWKEIAEMMDYDETYVRGKLHGKAVEEARKIWRQTRK